jgi:hypothetical protein
MLIRQINFKKKVSLEKQADKLNTRKHCLVALKRDEARLSHTKKNFESNYSDNLEHAVLDPEMLSTKIKQES